MRYSFTRRAGHAVLIVAALAAFIVGCGQGAAKKCEDTCTKAYQSCIDNASSLTARVNCDTEKMSCMGRCLNQIYKPMAPTYDEPAESFGPENAEATDDDNADCPCRSEQ